MKVVVQRVSTAKCIVDNKITGSINKGFMLLVGFTDGDNEEKMQKMAKKIAGLRIFEDENDKMNLNLSQVNGEILSISQFTLYGNPYEGNRPSFVDAMNPKDASILYLRFNQILRDDYHFKVEEGIFGAHMDLDIICDGPTTIMLEY